MKKNAGPKMRWVIVGHGPYGLTYGQIKATDSEIMKARAVRVYGARGIRYWYGKNGGITSLAAHGLCGPKRDQSRIGEPTASSLLLDVKAIHDCSPECVASFASFKSNV